MKEVRCDVCGGSTVPHVTGFSSYRRCISCGELVHIGQSQPLFTIREKSLNVDSFEEAVNDLQQIRRDLEEERLYELGG
jgi:hypothetical protein